MDNTSGQGERAIAPPEIRRWNWGAFLLNWIWGAANGVYIAFLMFIPLVNVVMIFVLGAKGQRVGLAQRALVRRIRRCRCSGAAVSRLCQPALRHDR